MIPPVVVRDGLYDKRRAPVFNAPYPYRTDTQNAFAELKAGLRTAAARTVMDLRVAIREAFTRFTPDECRNYLAAAGYDAYDPT